MYNTMRKINYHCKECDTKSHIVEGKCVVERLRKCPIMKKKCCSTCMFKVNSKEELKKRFKAMAATLPTVESEAVKLELRRLLNNLKQLS